MRLIDADALKNELEEMLGPETLGSTVSDYGVGIKFAIAAVNRAKTLKEMPKWISVEDRMPEPFVSVLTYMPDMPPFPPVREAYRVGNVFYIPALADREHVTHWMPMPEPPKEG